MPANPQVTEQMVEKAALAVSKARAHLTGSSAGVILPSDHLYATEALAAALADHVVGWRTMDSAPKDGERVLVWGQPENTGELTFHRAGAHTAYWDEIDGAFCLSGSTWQGPFVHPTHWMPLPAAPLPQKEG